MYYVWHPRIHAVRRCLSAYFYLEPLRSPYLVTSTHLYDRDCMSLYTRRIITTSLTIFAMLFGAGNLMFPLALGMQVQGGWLTAFLGFAVTGVVLPIVGLLAIVLFDGDYDKFFKRLGAFWGTVAIALCMIIIGPLIVMPRIVMLSYEMLTPFLPAMEPYQFALIFMSLVFAATYRPGKVLEIIGRVLSPLKIAAVSLIVLIGVLRAQGTLPVDYDPTTIFLKGVSEGYKTLDLLGTIFFGSIIVSLLSRYSKDGGTSLSRHDAAYITGISGLFAGVLIALVYGGMTYLAASHGVGLVVQNAGQLFSALSFKILGASGAALVGLTVFLACFTTSVSLAAVVADYAQRTLFSNRVSFAQAVIGVLLLTVATSSLGLTDILRVSDPIIEAFYPVLIVVTVANILYALTGFSWIKLPAAVTAVVMLIVQYT